MAQCVLELLANQRFTVGTKEPMMTTALVSPTGRACLDAKKPNIHSNDQRALIYKAVMGNSRPPSLAVRFASRRNTALARQTNQRAVSSSYWRQSGRSQNRHIERSQETIQPLRRRRTGEKSSDNRVAASDGGFDYLEADASRVDAVCAHGRCMAPPVAS